ncbi:cytochrome P450 [Trametopsis cervina]|nr:cytochrome P450 [Trametopsis cervina]
MFCTAQAFSNPLFCASLAGVLSWKVLNQHTVPGDYALLGFAAAVLILYLAVGYAAIPNALTFTVKVVESYLFSLTTATVAYRLSPWHPLAAYPGPILWRVSSLALAIVSSSGRRHLVLHELHKKYGKFVRIGPNKLSINSYTAAPVLYGARHHMLKDDSYLVPGHKKAVSLFFKQRKEDHSKRKRIWASAFASTAVQHFFPPLERRALQLTECIENRTDSNGVVDLVLCIAHFSYDFMGEMIFGGSNKLELMNNADPEDIISSGKLATALYDCIGQAPWLMEILWYLPGSELLHRAERYAAAMMNNRVMAHDVSIRDLSSYLLDANPRTGEKVPLRDLELEAVQAIPAGSDNTASTLTIALFYLLSNPVVYKTLQTELDKVFHDHTIPIEDTKLESIEYLGAVINEALRLGTPFYVPRIVPPQGTVIDGKNIPGGTVVALAAYSQQVAEENFYPHPLTFDPQRWLDNNEGSKYVTNKSAMTPFSSGPYVCVAKKFAVQEMRHVLARLVLTFDMTLPEELGSEKWLDGFKNYRTTIFEKPLLAKVTRRTKETAVVL